MATEVAVEDLRSARPREPRAVGKVEQYMTRDPICFRRDTPLEAALRALIEHKISGAPVVEPYEGDSTGSGRLVGVISEEDLLWKEVDATDRLVLGVRRAVAMISEEDLLWKEVDATDKGLLWKEVDATDKVRRWGGDVLACAAWDGQPRGGEVQGGRGCESISVTPDTPVKDAATIMLDAKIKRLPVVAPREGGRPGVTVVGVISRNDVLRHVLSVLVERGGRAEGEREGGRGRVEAGVGGAAGGKGGEGGKAVGGEAGGGAGGESGRGGVTAQAEVGRTGGGGDAGGVGEEGGKGEAGSGGAGIGGEGGKKVQTGLVKGGA
ncbi:unnamed protein product [Closterium sp. NIES-54]